MPINSKTFVRSTATLLLVGLLALLGIVGANVWLVERTQSYFEDVTQDRLARRSVVELRSQLQDLETGQRGYVITLDDSYLNPYREALPQIDSQLIRLRELLIGYPGAEDTLQQLSTDIAFKIDEMNRTIAEVQAGDRAAAVALVNTNEGKAAMDRIRAIIDTFVDAIDTRLSDGVGNQRSTIESLRWISIGGGLVILVVVSGAMFAVISYTAELGKARRAVEEANSGLEARVRERTADLGKANEEIQRFAYIVTHDLRAPLVNVMGFTSELETSVATLRSYMESKPDDTDPYFVEAREAATEELPEAISFIRAATRKMDGLINAILKISREGRRQLKPEAVDIREIAQNSSAAVHHQVIDGEGQIDIDVRVGRIVTDKLSLEQVFGNLLDNAIKYQEPDRPLKVAIRARNVPGNRVDIEIEDNGRGIADTDHERVFELFRRSGKQSQPGEGIGLAHVRTMVRSLGGDVTLRSTLGEGTTFIINLPRDLRSHKGTSGNE